jgi:hypothetical protein
MKNHDTLTSCLNPSSQTSLEGQTSLKPIKLFDYGVYPHFQGLQEVSHSACKGLAHTFNSLLNKLKRKFLGVPVYIGHPDDPHFSGQPGHTDTKAYGWVTGLEAKQDGLWIQLSWSKEGAQLLESKHYKFLSPRWEMVKTPKGTYTPIRLISMGLTNQPNIPCEALSNAASLSPGSGFKTYALSNALSFPPSHTPSQDFLALVHAYMKEHNTDYTSAWSHLKHTYPQLYHAHFC